MEVVIKRSSNKWFFKKEEAKVKDGYRQRNFNSYGTLEHFGCLSQLDLRGRRVRDAIGGEKDEWNREVDAVTCERPKTRIKGEQEDTTMSRTTHHDEEGSHLSSPSTTIFPHSTIKRRVGEKMVSEFLFS